MPHILQSHSFPLEVVKFGDAPEVVFVHGSSGNANVWQQLMQNLADEYLTSWAMSLRGHGNSDGAEKLQDFGIRDYVDDVKSVLREANKKVILVGHSMGGLVSQLTAAETQLNGLVLLASSPVGGMRGDGLRMFFRHPATFISALRRRSFKRLYRDTAVCRSLLFSKHTPLETVEKYCHNVTEESWKAGNEMNSLLPIPKQVQCPVLVVGGAEDRTVSNNSIRRTAAAYGVKAIFLDKAGHMLQLENSLPKLTEILVGFIRQNSSE